MRKKVQVLSIGQVARRCRRPVWQIRRLVTRGFIKEPPRIGIARVFLASELPAIRAALREAGYIGKRNHA